MTSQRDILFITTSEDDALNARLATQSAPVSEAAQDAFDIEVFTHVYDPERWAAWIGRSRDPILPSGITASQAAAALPSIARSTAEAVNAEWSGARADAAPPPSPGDVMVDATQPLYRVINQLSAQEQFDIVMAQFDSLSKAFRALNLSPLAIGALQRVHERLWGYMDPGSDAYLVGVGASLIENRVQVFSYTFGRQWRVRLSQWYNGQVRQQLYRDAREFGPGEVLFGFWGDQQNIIGCRVIPGENITAPVSCLEPTGEAHRIWWQTNAALSGGRPYPPAEMAQKAFRINEVGASGYDRAVGAGGQKPYDWNTAMFEPVTRPLTPWRLYVVPPLAWYWAIYFQPQPEFGGLSFVDWALSMSPAEFIRLQRRGVARANAEMADRYNTTVEGIVGQAQVDAGTEQANAVRRRNNALSLAGSGADAVANAVSTAAKDTPVIGLIAGVASLVGKVIGEIAKHSSDNDGINIDVYGRLMPAFIVFAIYSTKAAFDSAMIRQVPLPPAAPTITVTVGTVVGDGEPRVGLPASGGSSAGTGGASARRPSVVSLSGLRLATTAPVQIHGMPWYGGVEVDGVRVDGTWQDSGQTLWQVRATPGPHTIRVAAPDGSAQDFTVTVPATGVRIEMATGAIVPPATIVQTDSGYSLAQSDPAATWSTSTVSPTSPASPASPASPSGDGGSSADIPWGKILAGTLVLGAAGGGAAYVIHQSKKKPARATKANKRKKA